MNSERARRPPAMSTRGEGIRLASRRERPICHQASRFLSSATPLSWTPVSARYCLLVVWLSASCSLRSLLIADQLTSHHTLSISKYCTPICASKYAVYRCVQRILFTLACSELLERLLSRPGADRAHAPHGHRAQAPRAALPHALVLCSCCNTGISRWNMMIWWNVTVTI